MSELKILTIPDSRLKEKASQVKNFDQNLRSDIMEGRTGSSYKVLIGIQK